jgi:hypothetical protein
MPTLGRGGVALTRVPALFTGAARERKLDECTSYRSQLGIDDPTAAERGVRY